MTKRIATQDIIKATNVIDLADHRLTLKRQAFVRACLENGGNASAAYRKAYDAENMSDVAVRIEACRLRRHPNIALAIKRFHQGQDAETALTFGQHMEQLRELRDTAEDRGQLSAAVKAEFLRGRAMGFYRRDRAEHVATNKFANMSDEELRAFILDQDKALRALGIEMTGSTPKIGSKLKR
jgi:phage terminase small subunit